MSRVVGRARDVSEARGRNGRDLRRERLWRRRVREQAGGGVSVRDYCDCHGLLESAFYFWRREIARRDAESRTSDGSAQGGSAKVGSAKGVGAAGGGGQATGRPRFVPVVMARSPAEPQRTGHRDDGPQKEAAPPIELVHPGGTVLRVPAGCDAATLAAILDVLERQPC